MIRAFFIAVVTVGCLAVGSALRAQTPSAGSGSAPAPQEKGQGNAPKTADTQSSNPFPEDTANVPVIGNAPPPAINDTTGFLPLPGNDLDPVRSPDDPPPDTAASSSGWSSSNQGEDVLQPVPDAEKPRKHRKNDEEEVPVHHENAAEDLSVGSYYLDQKNWKGALSRFQSALVLDPENPEVYWGLAEADRGLGKLADARTNYQKVVDYDPDSKHGKQARKALREPAIASAQNAETAPAKSNP